MSIKVRNISSSFFMSKFNNKILVLFWYIVRYLKKFILCNDSNHAIIFNIKPIKLMKYPPLSFIRQLFLHLVR